MPEKKGFNVCTFNKVMTLEEAEEVKKSASKLGESLREADRLYEKRKRGE